MGEIAEIDPQEEWKLLVGGEWTSTAATYEVVDPNTTGVVGHAPDGSVADAEATIAAAKAAAAKEAALEAARLTATTTTRKDDGKVLKVVTKPLAGLVGAVGKTLGSLFD